MVAREHEMPSISFYKACEKVAHLVNAHNALESDGGTLQIVAEGPEGQDGIAPPVAVRQSLLKSRRRKSLFRWERAGVRGARMIFRHPQVLSEGERTRKKNRRVFKPRKSSVGNAHPTSLCLPTWQVASSTAARKQNRPGTTRASRRTNEAGMIHCERRGRRASQRSPC